MGHITTNVGFVLRLSGFLCTSEGCAHCSQSVGAEGRIMWPEGCTIVAFGSRLPYTRKVGWPFESNISRLAFAGEGKTVYREFHTDGQLEARSLPICLFASWCAGAREKPNTRFQSSCPKTGADSLFQPSLLQGKNGFCRNPHIVPRHRSVLRTDARHNSNSMSYVFMYVRHLPGLQKARSKAEARASDSTTSKPQVNMLATVRGDCAAFVLICFTAWS
jgi:hypothetical protein